jgi:hypothetical protein
VGRTTSGRESEGACAALKRAAAWLTVPGEAANDEETNAVGLTWAERPEGEPLRAAARLLAAA